MSAADPDGKLRTTSNDLIAAAAVGIVSVDADAIVLSANAAALAMLHACDADLVGLSAHDAFDGERPVQQCDLEAAVRAGLAMHVEEDLFTTASGADLPVWWASNPLRDQETGELLGAVIVFGDITARRARQAADAEEREQGRAELAEAQQSIADLEWVAGITQALSSTLNEVEVMQRLVRLVVGRLADVAVADLIDEEGVRRRVGAATAEGIDPGLAELVPCESVTADFEGVTAVPSPHVVEITDDGHALTLSLIARGHTVGVLALLRTGDRPQYTDVEQFAAVDIALRAALAVDNARLYEAQAAIATRLQRALLPSLPDGMPVRAAVRYLPARDRFDVGGDWYDVFQVTQGQEPTVLVVGDVAGHDLTAGTTMSALRHLLRVISVVTSQPPGGVLRLVDDNLDPVGIVGTATVLVMTVARDGPDAWRVRWSNAGHMPPVLLTPDGAEMLDEIHGPLLGTGLWHERGESVRVVPAGTTIVLYSDGLVETREETIEVGLTRLRRAAISLTAPLDDPDAIADELLARNHASVEDDTAMLVCHLPRLTAGELR